ncbi:MAG TPA: FAD-dependent monooxygenase [Dehalococcoidia bacterium]|nr:FAD-dependent monooxygenase [Dehalococcoidia bacterium]
MRSKAYDIITVGGGLGGSALALSMARHGAKVLVLERETKFKDRVRGEQLASWGVADAIDLGIYDRLLQTCAHELRWWDIYVMGQLVNHRDLPETTPSAAPNLTFYHPEMQEALIRAAEEAGAEVRRGVRVTAVRPGAAPEVDCANGSGEETLTVRLVVGADGRTSNVRKWGGFESLQDGQRLQIGGILVDGCAAPEDAAAMFLEPSGNGMAILFPQGKSRARAYAVSHSPGGAKFQGEKDVPAFIAYCIKAGMPAAWLEKAVTNGPLATFDGADSYVPQPFKEGIALVGDSAATSDPSWGQGLSLTLRDVRSLRDKLLANDDWEQAGQRYAQEHDWYYGQVHTTEDWYTEFFYTTGPAAVARRVRGLALRAQDPSRFPDTNQSGPESVVLDEAARRRMFGED